MGGVRLSGDLGVGGARLSGDFSVGGIRQQFVIKFFCLESEKSTKKIPDPAGIQTEDLNTN